MKIRRLIATIALLVGLLAGGLGGFTTFAPVASADCDASQSNSSSGSSDQDNSGSITIGGGQGSGDDCNDAS
jgi:hypothetical protein